jgi:hypothetical protein
MFHWVVAVFIYMAGMTVGAVLYGLWHTRDLRQLRDAYVEDHADTVRVVQAYERACNELDEIRARLEVGE